MINVGLIGHGNISKSHIGAYKHIIEDGVELKIAAVCDIRPEVFEDMGDARTYTDIDEMLKAEAGKLDYVDICLPTYLHCEAACKAMRAGFNVLSEKPMALNLEQAQAMVDTAKETGKQFMVAHCCRFMGAAKYIKSVIESGELGPVRSAEFYREGGSRKPMGYQNWFRKKELSGGAMLDLHIHDVDLINYLFGMPKAVSAVGTKVFPESGYDAMSVNYMYENGIFVNAKCDWTITGDRFNTRAIRVNFDGGYIFVDRSKDRAANVKVDGEGNMTDITDLCYMDMYYHEICYFIDCLKNGKPVDFCPPEQSAQAVQIVMAEMKSADKNGERVIV